MYFWNTKQLVKELRANALSEVDLKNYYLASSIIMSICFYAAVTEPRSNMLALTAEAIGALLVTILGINAAFKANGGATGVHFIEKAISISFPLLIKVLAASFLFGLIAGHPTAFGMSKYQREWVDVAVMLIIQSVFFWRLSSHVSAANS